MKKAALIPTVVLTLASIATLSGLPTRLIHPQADQALAQSMQDTTGLTFAQKIDLLNTNKGKFGSGDALRRFFFGDLEPIGVQPGGAGMVVNLYNKANDITFAYCATYDVVVAMKRGKVTAFEPNEVK